MASHGVVCVCVGWDWTHTHTINTHTQINTHTHTHDKHIAWKNANVSRPHNSQVCAYSWITIFLKIWDKIQELLEAMNSKWAWNNQWESEELIAHTSLGEGEGGSRHQHWWVRWLPEGASGTKRRLETTHIFTPSLNACICVCAACRQTTAYLHAQVCSVICH